MAATPHLTPIPDAAGASRAARADVRASALYLELLGCVEGLGGKAEVATAIARAAWSRARHGRGALHVRRPVVLHAAGLRWFVPVRDNSFASTSPGHDNNAVMPELRRLLAARPQRVCVDIGANLGFVSVPLAHEYPEHRFVAVEPVPWLADAIERSAQLNHLTNLAVVARALAPTPSVELAIPTVGAVRLTTLSSAAEQSSREARGRTVERLQVPAMTLDAVFEELAIEPGEVACLKIDVEGLEPEVLATGERALSAHPPVLFEALGADALGRVEQVLRGFGYGRFVALDAQNFRAER